MRCGLSTFRNSVAGTGSRDAACIVRLTFAAATRQRNTLLTALLVVSMSPGSAAAQTPNFPWDAIVDADDVEVRSGPSEQYYATSRLSRGSRVRVHREDPGGWYMIAPPDDSFSLIAAQYVRKIAPNRGDLIEDLVAVYVGSNLNEENNVFQRRLSRGDEVVILGQTRVFTDRGPERMYKIRCPKREWRWIPGRYVIDADEAIRMATNDRSGYATDSVVNRESVDASSRNSPAPQVNSARNRLFSEQPGANNAAVARTATNVVDEQQDQIPAAVRTAERDRLAQLDARFRLMISREAAEWDFDQLKKDYRQLQAEASDPAVAAQVTTRYPSLERYRRIQVEYQEFIELTSATSRRDEELRSRRSSRSLARRPETEPIVENDFVFEEFSSPEQVIDGSSSPSPYEAESPLSVTTIMPPAIDSPDQQFADIASGPDLALYPSGPQPAGTAGLVGAGIVRRSVAVPGVPDFVLLTPSGRILAYLVPEDGSDVDLSEYIDRSIGLEGERMYHDQLKADVIRVTRLRAVWLKFDN